MKTLFSFVQLTTLSILLPTLAYGMDVHLDEPSGRVFEGGSNSYILKGTLSEAELDSLVVTVQIDKDHLDELSLDRIDVKVTNSDGVVVTRFAPDSPNPLTVNQGRYQIQMKPAGSAKNATPPETPPKAQPETPANDISPAASATPAPESATAPKGKTDAAEKNKEEQTAQVEIEIFYQTKDDKKTNGIRHVSLNNSLVALNGTATDVERFTVELNDNEQDVVCASNNDLKRSSCYDIHIGSISILDANGEFKTRPFFLVLARTRLEDHLETDFEAAYYKLPQLTSDTAASDNPFEGEGGSFKITERIKWLTGYSHFNVMLAFGARSAPVKENRDKDISPFGLLAIERDVAFESARGIGGIGFAKDDFWKYTEKSNSTAPDITRDYSKRINLYGSLAMNKSGSVILSAYMDFNLHGDGPGEAGIALTFGGKWDSLLGNLGNL